uniref:Uncharacterized protein n=1 Tax=Aegilops tauschii subsp. strangulata TaxID=200361 RepID=A0A453CGA8_AEGTS
PMRMVQGRTKAPTPWLLLLRQPTPLRSSSLPLRPWRRPLGSHCHC